MDVISKLLTIFVDGLKAKVDGQEDIVDLIITDLNPRTLNEYFWVILGYLYGSTSAILSNIRALIRSYLALVNSRGAK